MKKILLLFLTLTLIHCKAKNEFEDSFASSFSMTALNSDNESVNFNIGYTVAFEKIKNQDCLVTSTQQLNDILIKPTIRSVIRKHLSNIHNDEIALINKQEIQEQIKIELTTADISINTSKFIHCPLAVSMLVITRIY